MSNKANKLKIIVPIAGEGTRLRPHTFSLPKPLIPIAGKPMLDHVIEPLIELDPDEIIFVVGYKKEALVKYIKSAYKINATFVEQEELLGLGYAVHLALKNVESSPVMVILGDTIAHTNYYDFANCQTNRLGLREVPDPKRFGVAIVKDGHVVELEEKPENPKSDLAVIGLYYFSNSDNLKSHLAKIVADDKRTRGEIQITDAMEMMIRDGEIFESYLVDAWLDCGKIEILLDTNQKLLDGLNQNKIIPGSEIIPPVYIGDRVVIENSKIGPYASIDGDAVVKDSQIENSVIYGSVRITNCQLSESLIGAETEIENENGTISRADKKTH